MTAQQVILKCAVLLSDFGKSAFTLSQLFVKSWMEDKVRFGLEGFEQQYPHTHRIRSNLDGKKGLVQQGYITKYNGYKFKVTDKGLIRYKREIEEQGTESRIHLRVDIPPAESKALKTFYTSALYNKAFIGEKKEICFADVMRALGLGSDVKPAQLIQAQITLEKALQTAMMATQANDYVEVWNGQIMDVGNINVLRGMYDYVVDRFQRHFNLLKKSKNDPVASH